VQHSELASNSTSDAQINTSMDFQTSMHNNINPPQAFSAHNVNLMSDDLLQPASSQGLMTDSITYMTDAVSWPWLHEDLFLPTSLLDPVEVQYGYAPLTTSGPTILTQGDPFQTQGPEESRASGWPLNQARRERPCGQGGHNSGIVFEQNCNSTDIHTPAHAGLPGSSITCNNSLNHSNVHADTGSADPTNVQMNQSQRSGNCRNDQTLVVHDLIAGASAEVNETCVAFWHNMSTKVADVFSLPVDPEYQQSETLHRFCKVYAHHFGPLWPLLSPQTVDFDALHPLLFLVLTSIGSMYCGSSASKYGVMMHSQIRSALALSIELGDGDGDFLWLAQARLLTQVAALYFGQPKAFTYAQHLGVLLVAQARRMDLFSAAQAASFRRKFHQMKGVASDQERLSVWMQLEARRRLAFGIFRADTYSSVLLHTKPLVCLEEIDLEFPMCDAVWRGEGMAPSLCLQIIEHDHTPGRELLASDMYRIALDQHEPLPPLDPFGQELLMFGLQYPIWRFSRDQKMFERLTGNEDRSFDDSLIIIPRPATRSASPRSPESVSKPSTRLHRSATGSEANHLESSTRLMADLELERRRLISALEKWEHALPLVKTFVRTKVDRSSLLSGLILFHTGYLSLYAPLRDLHQIQYHLADNRPVDPDLVTSVRQWANSRRGRLAAKHTCSIWSMIARESQGARDKRANFNLLAFAGLHHGAVILWSYAGAHDSASDKGMDATSLSSEASLYTIPTHPDESAKALQSFVELYDCISPARWSSFAKAADTLANQPFPLSETGPE
jgi:hypothetical protein